MASQGNDKLHWTELGDYRPPSSGVFWSVRFSASNSHEKSKGQHLGCCWILLVFNHHILHLCPSLIIHPFTLCVTIQAFTPCQPLPPPPFLRAPVHAVLAARAGQVAKPVSQSTVATRQYHRHQLLHSRGAAWQPHGNHMVQSGYKTTGAREGQEKWARLFMGVSSMLKISENEPTNVCKFGRPSLCLFYIHRCFS